MSNSYTPPDRSTYDPGWNDPPPMSSMTTSESVVVKPRTSLNKRVAFPMQSTITSSSNVKTTAEGLPLPFSTAKYQVPPMTSPIPEPSAAPAAVLPPPPSTSVLPPLQTSSTEGGREEEVFDSIAAKQFCNSVFSQLLDAMKIDAVKLSEIRKRLETLDQMWQDNKLNEAAQKNLHKFAKALENKDVTAAIEQHRLLVTQHINVSTQWATALRQIILSISPDSGVEAQSEPAVFQETDSVQLVDVSSKPVVMDSIPLIPPGVTISSSIPVLNPVATSDEQTTDDNTTILNANNIQSDNENTSKSRFGRFGRILHI